MKSEEVKYRLVRPFLSPVVFANMKKLYRKDELKKEIVKHYFSKIKLCLLVIFTFTILALLIYITGADRSIKNGQIKRNEKGGINKTVDVDVYSGKNKIYEKRLQISSKKYSDEEVEKLYLKFDKNIKNEIKGKNKSLDYVTEDLVFKKKMDGLPFEISYKTNRPLIISSDGKVKIQNLNNTDEERIVEISVTAKYEDFEETKLLYVQVFRKDKSSEEALADEIDKAIEHSDFATEDKDFFILPSRVLEKNIVFKEKKTGSSTLIFMLGILSAAVIYFGKDKEINDRIMEINKEMDAEYALLINKFALFYNANMPIKKIWKKICADYEQDRIITGKKKYVYEEMMYTNALMNEGMSEIRAYDEFAKRCSTQKYRLFVNMLKQAVTKGKNDMSLQLINEAREAFTERKNNAKRLGEEASTKLLIPMFMMLMIVMVMIIFPAFYSFKME